MSGERQLFPSPDGRDAPPELVKKKLKYLLFDMALLYLVSRGIGKVRRVGKRERGTGNGIDGASGSRFPVPASRNTTLSDENMLYRPAFFLWRPEYVTGAVPMRDRSRRHVLNEDAKMNSTKLQNLPVRTEVKGGLNPQPLPPRVWNPIVVNPIFRFVGR